MTRIRDRLVNAKILIIDDNRGDIMLTRKAFERSLLAVEIQTAYCAEDGLQILRRQGEYGGQRHPDLVLCDLNLPRMSGVDFLKVVKADPQLRRIPILILSSSCLETDVRRCYDSFASGYITKPCSIAEYDEVVGKVEQYWFNVTHCPPDYDDACEDVRRSG
jgi:CheY-like chemotaxis protein